LITGPKKKLK